MSFAHAAMSAYNNAARTAMGGKVASRLRSVSSGWTQKEWEATALATQNAERIAETLIDTARMLPPRPFLLQCSWHTTGAGGGLRLADPLFGLYVWSDTAVLSLPALMLKATMGKGQDGNRALRSACQAHRALADLLDNGRADFQAILKEMTFGRQTDKGCAVSGSQTIKTVFGRADEYAHADIGKDVLHKLIPPGARTTPERLRRTHGIRARASMSTRGFHVDTRS